MKRQIQKTLEQKGMNMLSLATSAHVSYSTVHDLITGRVPAEKAKYVTLHPLALALDMSTDEFVQACEYPEVEDYVLSRTNPAVSADTFAAFRDNLHHRLKAEGDEAFLIELLKSDDTGLSLLKQMYKMSLADYLCNKLGLPLADRYAELRRKKLAEPYYVGDSALFMEKKPPIQEFAVHNIIEGDLYDAY